MANDLESQCEMFIPGSRKPAPAEYFAEMAQWCEKNNIQHDVYGDGDLIQSFEQKVADLLGFEAGLFVITGTMTQATVLELVCKQKRNPLVGMHESSHITRFESQGYRMQNRFDVLPLGNRYRPWTCDDLKTWPDEFAAALYELPMRELGGNYLAGKSLRKLNSIARVKTYTFIWMVLVFGNVRAISKKNTMRLPVVLIVLMCRFIKGLTA